MTSENRLLSARIEARANKSFELRYPDGSLCSLSPLEEREALKLANAGFVVGQINKHQFLRYLKLTVTVAAARRLLMRNRKHNAERLPIAEDNFTVEHIRKGSGQYFQFRDEVTKAYAR